MSNRQSTLQSREPKAIADLRAFYGLGSAALTAAPPVPKGRRYAIGVIRGLQDSTQQSRDRLFKARKFARTYTKEQLEELCSQRMPHGTPLGIGHVMELILVKRASDRRRLQMLAVQNGWSIRQLKNERIRLFGASPMAKRAGCLPRRPKTKEEALLQLEQRVNVLLRWAKAIEPQDASAGVSLSDLPKRVTDKLAAAVQALEELKAEIGKAGSSQKL